MLTDGRRPRVCLIAIDRPLQNGAHVPHCATALRISASESAPTGKYYIMTQARSTNDQGKGIWHSYWITLDVQESGLQDIPVMKVGAEKTNTIFNFNPRQLLKGILVKIINIL